uniref:Uncharacterized protein n=1 Tax=mine drainage metagenome TaxID=410659 RepID=E6Q6D2_9ZZZZ
MIRISGRQEWWPRYPGQQRVRRSPFVSRWQRVRATEKTGPKFGPASRCEEPVTIPAFPSFFVARQYPKAARDFSMGVYTDLDSGSGSRKTNDCRSKSQSCCNRA